MLLSSGQLIKQSWEQYTRHWKSWLLYSVATLLPAFVVGLLLAPFFALANYLSRYYSANVSLVVSGLIFLVFVVALVVVMLWTSLVLATVIQARLKNAPVTRPQEVFKMTWPKIWPAFYTGLLAALIIAGGALLLIIPGIIFAGWYAFSAYAVLFDNQRGMGALRFSKNLVRGRWGQVVWRLIVPGLVFSIVSGLLRVVVISVLNRILPLSVSIWANLIVSLVIQIATIPLPITAILLLYSNTKETPASIPTPTPAPVQQ